MKNRLVEQLRGQKILVLGDLMLDEYLWGDARRISPEAPVPVVDIQRETVVPGGAGNVAVNVASLEGKVYLGGVVGVDAAAGCLRGELSKLDIDLSGIMEDERRPTITKTRLVARSQQMVRYDREIRASLSAWQQQALLDWIETILPQVSLCIFSDYAKGISSPDFMQAFIGLAERFQKPVLVDPKGNSLQKYRGAMLVTPNLLEVEQATGMVIHSDDDFLAAYRIMQVQVPGTNILIKLGARGMILFQPDGETFHAEAKARQVFDVTGAGDTVIATVAIALAAGASLHESIQLASLAAGIVVGKVGTASTTLVELSAHLKEIEGLWQQ